MEICIFYSWQSSYRNNCDKIISKALGEAVEELNKEIGSIQYVIERGGGGVLGAEHIDEKIVDVINNRADLAFVDFTHVGAVPQKDASTGEWIKKLCAPNTNAVNENGRLENALNLNQVFKVYNTAYGDLKSNLEMPFDIRQEHFPLDFYCDDTYDDDARKTVREQLKKGVKNLIKKGTEAFLDNQKVRYAPLNPMRNEYDKQMYKSSFIPVGAYTELKEQISSGQSFRLLGLPGLGKTRMVGEAFRGNDIDVYYCDCKEQSNRSVIDAVEKLLTQRSKSKQVVILDNCDQKLCGIITDTINENGFNCQLITIHYDPNESIDTGIEGHYLKVTDTIEVVESLLLEEREMSPEIKDSIKNLAGGFPLMAKIMIDNFHRGIPIANVSKKDVFERMLGIDTKNVEDVDKLKVLTAFSIFKFIGLYKQQEKHGRFIAGNKIVTNIKGTEDDNLQLFKEVHSQYQKVDILERQGNLVLMRLIPLAIYLCKSWFDKQSSDSIASLVNQIRSCPDEGTRNMVMESLSQRITLLNDIPLAQNLRDGLTNPECSPFLTEEVVLSTPGSRLFLAFSEVNPESCAIALHRIVSRKSDEEIKGLASIRRNIAWSLDHLAFDKRSFKNAMLTLARLSLVETEVSISNNTTGLFVQRFAILLSGTEVNLQDRILLIEDLLQDLRYEGLVKKSLLYGLQAGHFHRFGGAEKQGTKKLKDFVPSQEEVIEYYSTCLEILLSLVKCNADFDVIAKTIASNARNYYLSGTEDFLFQSIEKIAPKKDFVWEEMKEALSAILIYDSNKRNNYHIREIEDWKSKLTKDDYVYTLLHLENDLLHNYHVNFEDNVKRIHESYKIKAKELIDNKLYKNSGIMSGIFSGKCFYFNKYGVELSEYSKEKGVQKELLDVIIDNALRQETTYESESILLYFLIYVDDKVLLNHTYESILKSTKKYLLVAAYAIKTEGEEKQSQLFDLLDSGDLSINNFALYFNYRSLNQYDVKYVVRRLLGYGAEGASMVLTHCQNFLFDGEYLEEEYQNLARQCLLQIDLEAFHTNDYLYLICMNNYLVKCHDDELALHIHNLQEKSFNNPNLCNNYYLGRLYRKVLFKYTSLLKNRLLALLDNRLYRHQCVKLLRASYPQDGDITPTYTFMSTDDWFDWMAKDNTEERAYLLAMMFNYANDNHADPIYIRLIEKCWSRGVKDALSSRFHSYSWSGTGISLYRSRIAISEDYISKLTNEDAKEWFKNDIEIWKEEIEHERLQNAHDRAIYD